MVCLKPCRYVLLMPQRLDREIDRVMINCKFLPLDGSANVRLQLCCAALLEAKTGAGDTADSTATYVDAMAIPDALG